jgi:hyaluronoglucosaminidase
MELFEASKIAVATIADYLANPGAYDPEASWQSAIADVAGAPDREAFALFADNVRSSCLSADDAPIVSEALATFLFRTEQGDGAAAAVDLAALAGRLSDAAEHLLRGPVTNPALVAECRPWIAAFETGARAIAHIARLGAAGRLDSDGPVELRPWLVALRQARVRVFGDALDMTLADLTNTHVRPGELTITDPEAGAG